MKLMRLKYPSYNEYGEQTPAQQPSRVNISEQT